MLQQGGEGRRVGRHSAQSPGIPGQGADSVLPASGRVPPAPGGTAWELPRAWSRTLWGTCGVRCPRGGKQRARRSPCPPPCDAAGSTRRNRTEVAAAAAQGREKAEGGVAWAGAHARPSAVARPPDTWGPQSCSRKPGSVSGGSTRAWAAGAWPRVRQGLVREAGLRSEVLGPRAGEAPLGRCWEWRAQAARPAPQWRWGTAGAGVSWAGADGRTGTRGREKGKVALEWP